MSENELNADAARRREPDPELVERPRRRGFTAQYKMRISREVDACAAG